MHDPREINLGQKSAKFPIPGILVLFRRMQILHLYLEKGIGLSKKELRASAHNYGPNNGTSRKIDFAHFLPIDWP